LGLAQQSLGILNQIVVHKRLLKVCASGGIFAQMMDNCALACLYPCSS
jgi:hypothetical protein